MSRPSMSKVRKMQCAVVSQSAVTVLTTPWQLIGGGGVVQMMQQITGLAGNWQSGLQFRSADVRTDYPNGWTSLGSNQSTEGAHVAKSSSLSGDFMWIQGGVAASLSTGTTAAEAFVKAQTTVDTDAVLVASRTVQVNPVVGTQTAFVPLGSPFPATGLTALMFACIVSQVNGTLSYRPAWRGIAGDPAKAGNYTQIGTAQSNVTTEETHNFGRVSVSPSSSQNLAQVALSYSGSDIEAQIAVIVAAVYG